MRISFFRPRGTCRLLYASRVRVGWLYKGKVFGFVFEPVQQNLFYLKEHLRLNHARNVAVIEAAVSDNRGLVSFGEGPNSSIGHIVATNGKLQVKAVALDELISTGEIPRPDYMKIGIEGAEVLALSGAK